MGPVAEPGLRPVAPPRSVFRRKRFLLPFLPAALIALVGVVALTAGGTVALPFHEVVVIRGRLASKGDFFADPEVKRVLLRHGIRLALDSAGSREIATGQLEGYDFVFPSGQPAASMIKQRWQRDHPPSRAFKPFFTPIVLATFPEYADALVTAGVARRQDGGLYHDVFMDRFVALSRAGTRWGALAPGLVNDNVVLAQTSDVCSSNSAATYLGLVAFVENGAAIPRTEPEAVALAERIKGPLTSQGMASDDLAKNYLSPDGRTLAPIAVIYEHQFLAHQVKVKRQTGRPDTSRALLYPAAQLQTVPELIALSPAGVRLGELVTTDPALRARALELGFRVYESDASVSAGEFARFLSGQGLPVPVSGVGDTETFLPELPLLEKMIDVVGGCGR